MKPFYFIVYYSLKAYFFVFHRHSTYGLENLTPGAAILAPNHASFFDPPLVCVSCPEEINYLARGSLFKNRFFGWLIRSLNAYPVSGTAQDLASFKLVCELLAQGKKVVIFPEGIRTFDGEFAPIKSGIGMLAQRGKSPVIPIYLHGSYDVWSRHRRLPRLWGKTACVFGKPIHWQDFAHLDKKEAQIQIAKAVEDSLKSLREWYHNHQAL